MLPRFLSRWACLVVIGMLLLSAGARELAAADGALPAEQLRYFEAKIRPVLVRECYGCHSNQVGQVRGGLWLDSAEGMRTGGDSGPAVVPGNLDESLLWSAINHADLAMPPRSKLSAEILADFKAWIEMGAPDPRTAEATVVRSAITAEDIVAGRQFWSFQPPVRPAVPVCDDRWPLTDIDRYIFEQWTSRGLAPPEDAAPATLLRRLYFDLIGLPPTPEQVITFETRWEQNSELALDQTIDELLARPQFGERWARHWLDVARYAESSGREINLSFPTAWRYRDYVIDAFNQDKPYDRFVQEQLAGDLLPAANDQQWATQLVATGFLAIGPKTLTEQNPRQFELDLVDEQIDVVTRVMLGVSVACARCHDHKFDPIPQTDYYALAGIFRGMTTHYGTFRTLQNRRPSNLIVLPEADNDPLVPAVSARQLQELQAELESKQRELQQGLQARRMRQTTPSGTSPAPQARVVQVAQISLAVGLLQAQIDLYDDDGSPLSLCMAVQDGKPSNQRLLERGEFNRPAQLVPRGLPQVLCQPPVDISEDSTGRLELARWIGSRENPLTARVMANRVWQHLLGNGLVRTPEDFGATGSPPTHPELLDYLAVELMDRDWRMKQLIREIVRSRVYRISSQYHAGNFAIDPENLYLWRMQPRRLEGEVIRDAMLAISGRLESDRPTASVVARAGPAIIRDNTLLAVGISGTGTGGMTGNRPRGSFMAGLTGSDLLRPAIRGLDEPSLHRSVYLPIVRDQVPRALDVFDFAEPSMVVGQRDVSNTADQGLYLLNNAFVIEQADALARRLLRQSRSTTEQLQQAFLLAYGRPATATELRLARNFHRSFDVDQAQPSPAGLRGRPASGGLAARTGDQAYEREVQRMSAVCQAIMAAAEFRYLY